MSKYEPLSQFLETLNRPAHRMSFCEIERILGFKLPKSAYEHQAWWSNNDTGHSHARAWLARGWRTESVDLKHRQVSFERSGTSSLESGSGKYDPWGCMAGTITIMPGVDLTQPTGVVWNAREGRLLNE